MNAVQKLRQLVGELRAGVNPLKVHEVWELAGRLLGRMPVDQAEVSRVVKERDINGLDALVFGLENPKKASAPKPDAAATGGFTNADMSAAMRAFKKRLRLLRLSEESKLGGRYTSGGKKSSIDAIMPPDDYPKAMWDALVAAGKLKYTGQGFYALP